VIGVVLRSFVVAPRLRATPNGHMLRAERGLSGDF
jgi:hypothetical protein